MSQGTRMLMVLLTTSGHWENIGYGCGAVAYIHRYFGTFRYTWSSIGNVQPFVGKSDTLPPQHPTVGIIVLPGQGKIHRGQRNCNVSQTAQEPPRTETVPLSWCAPTSISTSGLHFEYFERKFLHSLMGDSFILRRAKTIETPRILPTWLDRTRPEYPRLPYLYIHLELYGHVACTRRDSHVRSMQEMSTVRAWRG